MQTANILKLSLPDYADSKQSQFVYPGLCRLRHLVMVTANIPRLCHLVMVAANILILSHLVMMTANILRLSHLVMVAANILRLSPPDYTDSKHSQNVST